jgi:hypothetical protein
MSLPRKANPSQFKARRFLHNNGQSRPRQTAGGRLQRRERQGLKGVGRDPNETGYLHASTNYHAADASAEKTPLATSLRAWLGPGRRGGGVVGRLTRPTREAGAGYGRESHVPRVTAIGKICDERITKAQRKCLPEPISICPDLARLLETLKRLASASSLRLIDSFLRSRFLSRDVL